MIWSVVVNNIIKYLKWITYRVNAIFWKLHNYGKLFKSPPWVFQSPPWLCISFLGAGIKAQGSAGIFHNNLQESFKIDAKKGNLSFVQLPQNYINPVNFSAYKP